MKRRRLNSVESRALALQAAHALLLEERPQAVTVQAVARRVGWTHANVIHHFGSVAGLHREMGRNMATMFAGRIAVAVRARRAGEASIHDTADLLFDAVTKSGGAELLAWMKLSGNEDAHEPIMETITILVQEFAVDGYDSQVMSDLAMSVFYLAIGDALIGRRLTDSLGLPRDRPRQLAAQMIEQVVADAERARETSE